MDYYINDFTELEYRSLLQLLKKNWEVVLFPSYRKRGKICLWRHDVDFSPHRAYRLAKIEAEEGITSTYFIHLHSKFYNAFEDEIVEKFSEIVHLGHDLGLHFDPEFYALQVGDKDACLQKIKFERRILEELYEIEINSFSFHNPDIGGWIAYDDDKVDGMVSAYGRYIKKNFGYCSDSNGYWRFRRLRDVLKDSSEKKLHVLTHPEMWTPEPMPPYARVKRCVDGRAAAQLKWYEEILAKSGRENVR